MQAHAGVDERREHPTVAQHGQRDRHSKPGQTIDHVHCRAGRPAGAEVGQQEQHPLAFVAALRLVRKRHRNSGKKGLHRWRERLLPA